ncbi:hypothetical protein BH09ACT10_BH09ACT10_21690 [soil metagenome]
MSRRLIAASACIAALAILSACTSSDNSSTTNPTASAQTTAPADVEKHESGPESPIGYDLQVPSGATQLGPLVRSRTAGLIAEFQPDLDAIMAQREAALNEKRQEAIANGETVAPPTTPPTDSPKPKDDTFKLLDDPPKPDLTVSLMRIDGDPSKVTSNMIGQIASTLPDAGIDKEAWANYCTVRDDRVTRCAVDVTGLSKKGRQLRITMSVNPGNIKTRTSPPGAQLKPIMTVSVNDLTDPKADDDEQTPSATVTPTTPAPTTAATSVAPETLIWPRMDVDASLTEPLLDGVWVPPTGATLLLSGNSPSFVALVSDDGAIAEAIGRTWVETHSDKDDPTVDTVDELNEISTTYTAQSSKKGLVATATYVQSGRGNYVILNYTPPTD